MGPNEGWALMYVGMRKRGNSVVDRVRLVVTAI